MPSGLLVGGSDRGVIRMFDVDRLIKGENSIGELYAKILSRCAGYNKRFLLVARSNSSVSFFYHSNILLDMGYLYSL